MLQCTFLNFIGISMGTKGFLYLVKVIRAWGPIFSLNFRWKWAWDLPLISKLIFKINCIGLNIIFNFIPWIKNDKTIMPTKPTLLSLSSLDVVSLLVTNHDITWKFGKHMTVMYNFSWAEIEGSVIRSVPSKMDW